MIGIVTVAANSRAADRPKVPAENLVHSQSILEAFNVKAVTGCPRQASSSVFSFLSVLLTQQIASTTVNGGSGGCKTKELERWSKQR